jgi:hypothetical protein
VKLAESLVVLCNFFSTVGKWFCLLTIGLMLSAGFLNDSATHSALGVLILFREKFIKKLGPTSGLLRNFIRGIAQIALTFLRESN